MTVKNLVIGFGLLFGAIIGLSVLGHFLRTRPNDKDQISVPVVGTSIENPFESVSDYMTQKYRGKIVKKVEYQGHFILVKFSDGTYLEVYSHSTTCGYCGSPHQSDLRVYSYEK